MNKLNKSNKLNKLNKLKVEQIKGEQGEQIDLPWLQHEVQYHPARWESWRPKRFADNQ